jgi:hypothetical protein
MFEIFILHMTFLCKEQGEPIATQQHCHDMSQLLEPDIASESVEGYYASEVGCRLGMIALQKKQEQVYAHFEGKTPGSDVRVHPVNPGYYLHTPHYACVKQTVQP